MTVTWGSMKTAPPCQCLCHEPGAPCNPDCKECRPPLARDILSLVLTAVEFGFRECERGRNLQMTLAEARKSWGETF